MGSGFRESIGWQKAIELCIAVYSATSTFPQSESFGLTSQLRRAAVSVPSNIAEGFGRQSTGEYRQFLGHARGSNSEVETQLVIARSLGFGRIEQMRRAEALCSETGRIINSMMAGLREKSLGP